MTVHLALQPGGSGLVGRGDPSSPALLQGFIWWLLIVQWTPIPTALPGTHTRRLLYPTPGCWTLPVCCTGGMGSSWVAALESLSGSSPLAPCAPFPQL